MKALIGQGTGDERKHEQGNRLEHAGKDYWQRIAGKGLLAKATRDIDFSSYHK
jgi:hypothetical protein